MFKLVHCGDFHIGAPIGGLPAQKRAIRRAEINAALMRTVEFCNENAVNALLICGDLFDSPTPKKSDADAVCAAFAALNDTQVYIIAGNHDRIVPDGVYSSGSPLGENVHLFPPEGAVFTHNGENVCFYGASYTAPCAPRGLTLPPPKKGAYNIALLHGDLSDSGDYATFSRATLADSGYSYIALGHIHAGELFSCGDVPCGYCGTPEPHGFDDDGQTGIILCTLENGNVKAEHIPLSKRRCVHLDFDISSAASQEDIVSSLRKVLSPENLYRISLCGTTRPFEISLPYILQAAEDCAFFVSLKDCTVPEYNLGDIMEEPGLRGAFLRRLKEAAPSDDVFERAARMGLCALDGRDDLLRCEL